MGGTPDTRLCSTVIPGSRGVCNVNSRIRTFLLAGVGNWLGVVLITIFEVRRHEVLSKRSPCRPQEEASVGKNGDWLVSYLTQMKREGLFI